MLMAEFIAYPLSEGRFYLAEPACIDADRRPVWVTGVVAPCAPQELGWGSGRVLAPLRVATVDSCEAAAFPVNTWGSFMAWEKGQVLAATMTLLETLFVPLPFLSRDIVFEAVSRRLASGSPWEEVAYEAWFTRPIDPERFVVAQRTPLPQESAQ